MSIKDTALRIIAGSTQAISITSSSAPSSAIGVAPTATVFSPEVVRVISTVNCHITTGAAPTATTSHAFLTASIAEYFTIKPGEKIAIVKASGASDGTVYITRMTGSPLA